MDTISRVFALLDERGEGQKVFAESIGVFEQVVSRWKLGKSKSYTKYIDKIAEHLGVSVAYLMGETEKRTPAEKVDPRRKAIADMVYSLSAEEFDRLEQIINAVFANRK